VALNRCTQTRWCASTSCRRHLRMGGRAAGHAIGTMRAKARPKKIGEHRVPEELETENPFQDGTSNSARFGYEEREVRPTRREQQREANQRRFGANIPVKGQTTTPAKRATSGKFRTGFGRLRLFTWSKAPERLRRGRNSRNRTAARGLRSQGSSPSFRPSRQACPDASSEVCD
jgi:hypothetical protein